MRGLCACRGWVNVFIYGNWKVFDGEFLIYKLEDGILMQTLLNYVYSCSRGRKYFIREYNNILANSGFTLTQRCGLKLYEVRSLSYKLNVRAIICYGVLRHVDDLSSLSIIK